MGLGALTTLFYVINVKEAPLTELALEREAKYKQFLGQVPMKDESKSEKKGKTAGDWLGEAQFYIFGLVYMFARISLNTSATIMPLYLTVVNGFVPPDGASGTSVNLAGVPLLSYIFSLLWSALAQTKVTQKFRNRLIPMVIAIVVTTIGSLPMAFLGSGDLRYLIYLLAPLQGVGNALMLNTGTSCISDVIGQDNTSAAFVYGAYSLADKFANGILLYFLVAAYADKATPLGWIISIVPIFSAVACTLCTWIGIKLYADKLAKISSGSLLKNRQRENQMAKEQAQEKLLAPKDH